MAPTLIEKSMFLEVPFSSTYDDVELRSRSNSSMSNASSIIDDEWTAIASVNQDIDQTKSLKDDIVAQVLSNTVLLPWQDEQLMRSDEMGTLYCCLGISPSQFRRLMPSRQNAKDGSNDLAVLYAQVAMQYTFQQTALPEDNNTNVSLIVLIVDAIQKYNFAVFNNKQLKTGTALKYALEEGDRLADVFTQARSRLAPELAERVTIIRWHDICNQEYDECVNALEQHWAMNKKFAELVDEVVEVFINVRKPNGNFTEQQRGILRQYVLNELPALARGINYNGHHCPIIFHPVLSSGDAKNDNQRDVMLRLLNYIRHSSELRTHLNVIEEVPMCEVYDIAMTALR